MTYSIDFRKKVVKSVSNGQTFRSTAKQFGVSPWTIQKWCKYKSDLAPKKHGQRKRKINKIDLKQHVINFPDMILRESE